MIPNYLLHIAMGVHRGTHRDTNEDAVAYQYPSDYDLLLLRGALVVVADGVAAKGGGAAASQMAVSYLIDAYYRQPFTMSNKDSLIEAIKAVNTDVYDAFRGSSTTLVAAVIFENRLIVAHVGDSRAYRIRKKGIQQLTHDHVVNVQTRDGTSQSNLTRALGFKAKVDIDLNEFAIEEGDTILLATDGVTRYLSNQKLWRLVQTSPTDAVRDIIHAANRAGGKDNIGVVVVNVAEEIASQYRYFVHLSEMQPEIIVHVPEGDPIASSSSTSEVAKSRVMQKINDRRINRRMIVIGIIVAVIVVIILLVAYFLLNT